MDLGNVEIIVEITLSFLLFLATTAAFWIALITYRDGHKPIVSLAILVQDDWIMLQIKNTGRRDAQEVKICSDCNTKKNELSISCLPPEVTCTFKLEPYAIIESLPISERIVLISYSYIDRFNKKHTTNEFPIQINRL